MESDFPSDCLDFVTIFLLDAVLPGLFQSFIFLLKPILQTAYPCFQSLFLRLLSVFCLLPGNGPRLFQMDFTDRVGRLIYFARRAQIIFSNLLPQLYLLRHDLAHPVLEAYDFLYLSRVSVRIDAHAADDSYIFLIGEYDLYPFADRRYPVRSCNIIARLPLKFERQNYRYVRLFLHYKCEDNVIFEKYLQKSLQLQKNCLPLQSQSKERVVLKQKMVS